MEKWAIRPDPSPFDPRRHVLLVKGTMKDISAILLKFGAQCGRPSPVNSPEGFNYSLILHAITQVGIERLSGALNVMSGVALPSATSTAGTAAALGAAFGAPPAFEPPSIQPPSLGEPPAVLPPSFEPPSLGEPPVVLPPSFEPPSIQPPSLGEPPMILTPSLSEPPSILPPGLEPPPGLTPPSFEPALGAADGVAPSKSFEPMATMKLPTPPEPQAAPPAFLAEPAAGLGAPEMDKSALPSDPSQLKTPTPPPTPAPAPELVSLAPAAPGPELSLASPAAAPAGGEPAPAAGPEISLAPPAAAPGGGAPSFTPQPLPERPMWGLPVGLNAECTFDTLLVGPYNRFAHAAATSVVGSPGSMYNPLFLYGAGGVGKTHVAFAIAAGLAQTLTADGVIVTSGSRLARAVSAAVAESRFAELEQYLAQRKALVVDDIHLLAVTEANKAQLARVFDLFFGKGLQVVLTSIYPPKALGALEEALKISLGKGWSVDLKVPGQNVQLELLQAFFDKASIQANNEITKSFHERILSNYADWKRWALRLRTLSQLKTTGSEPPKVEDILPILFDPGVPAGSPEFPTPEELQSVTGFSFPPAGPDAVPLAVILPKGQEQMGAWVASRFFEAGKLHAVPTTFRQVLLETYDAGQPFGVPFQIGDMCVRSGARAALIIGPPADSGLAARVGEFSHAVSHILDGLDTAMGWVPHNGTTSASHFLRAHLDIMNRPA